MKRIINILSIIAITVLTSCEKVIDIDYKNNQSTVVIEGNITNQVGAYYVKVSKSIPLSTTTTNPTIDNAIVTISDDAGNNETLTTQGNGLYKTNSIIGVVGRTYTLTVNAEGKTYTAQSTMPQKVIFDSIKVEKNSFAGETKYNLIPVYNDPIAKGNNYRFVFSLNGKLVNQHLIQNDDVKNGTVNTQPLEIEDNDLKFKQGDLISLQMQCVDSKVGLYYTTLALIANSGPGGGTTPSNPTNNFTNGALGLFSAHTTETKNITLP